MHSLAVMVFIACVSVAQGIGYFEPYEAYNATLLSAIAYTDDPVRCANTLFPDKTFEIVEVIGRKCNYLFQYKECFAVAAISHQNKMIVIAYRGTYSPKQLVDQFATVLGKLKTARVSGGHVQEYFSNANDQLYTCVRSCMSDLVKNYPTYRVMITGHSLGGAIASIASAQLSYDNEVDKEKTTLYTFGMPRPGDITYAKRHDFLVPNSWRLVHFRDIVPKLPTKTPFSSSPYHHLREIYYGQKMTVTSEYTECSEYEDAKCGGSVLPSLWSYDYHINYYGIPVGSYCDDKMKRRRKRSDEDSDMSHLFNFESCKRINVSDMPTSRANARAAFKILSITFMLISLKTFQQLS